MWTHANDLRVLVLDDDIAAATRFAERLQVLGCRTAVAFDTESGLRVMRLFKPLLVFVDLLLPAAGGLALVQRARASARVARPDAVFVCVGAWASGEMQRAIEATCQRFLLKPVKQKVLKEVLSDARTRLGGATSEDAEE